MNTNPGNTEFLLREAKLGGCVWLVLAVSSYFPGSPLGIVEVLFLLAPWVLVPLGMSLIIGEARRASPAGWYWILPVLAALTTISFFVARGVLSACLAGSWFLVCVVAAGDGVRRFFFSGKKSFQQFCFAVGEGYLAVAGTWLVASRAGLHPLGFFEPIVLLTAIHFHFAGYASAILAGLTCAKLRGARGERMARLAALAVTCGPGLLGLLFLLGPKWKLAGALIVAVGQFGLTAGMTQVALKEARGIARGLLLVAAGSVAAGMLLAAVWAVGEYPLQPFVDIREMAEFHGVLNAFGFAICGLFGWAQLARANGVEVTSNPRCDSVLTAGSGISGRAFSNLSFDSQTRKDL